MGVLDSRGGSVADSLGSAEPDGQAVGPCSFWQVGSEGVLDSLGGSLADSLGSAEPEGEGHSPTGTPTTSQPVATGSLAEGDGLPHSPPAGRIASHSAGATAGAPWPGAAPTTGASDSISITPADATASRAGRRSDLAGPDDSVPMVDRLPKTVRMMTRRIARMGYPAPGL
ncbi:MAG: hypothetical protein ACXWOW_06335 [Candidatus Limnocylindrales bacterium]